MPNKVFTCLYVCFIKWFAYDEYFLNHNLATQDIDLIRCQCEHLVSHQSKQTLSRILNFPSQSNGLYVVDLGTRKNTISQLFLVPKHICCPLDLFYIHMFLDIKNEETFCFIYFFSLGFSLKIFQPLRVLRVNKGKPKLKEASGLAVENS